MNAQARVTVHIEHGDAQHDDEYLDIFYLDGLKYGLVSGEAKLLQLAPGKHELELVSQRMGNRLQLVSTSDFSSSTRCITPNCQDAALSLPAVSERLELAPSSEADCAKIFVLDVQAGESHEAVLVASPDGTCRTRG
jgi:hypothetical protein